MSRVLFRSWLTRFPLTVDSWDLFNIKGNFTLHSAVQICSMSVLNIQGCIRFQRLIELLYLERRNTHTEVVSTGKIYSNGVQREQVFQKAA